MTARRRALWVAIPVAVVVVAGVVAVIWVRHTGTDCVAVHQINTAVDHFTTDIAHDINHPTQPIAGDYPALLDRLNDQADKITDAGLSRRAHDLAALASKIAALIPRIRHDKLTPVVGSTPAQQELTRVNAQFNDNLSALARACPDDSQRLRIG